VKKKAARKAVATKTATKATPKKKRYRYVGPHERTFRHNGEGSNPSDTDFIGLARAQRDEIATLLHDAELKLRRFEGIEKDFNSIVASIASCVHYINRRGHARETTAFINGHLSKVLALLEKRSVERPGY
jgi:hypothetical protein